MPAYGRKPSCHYLQLLNHHFLVDCGEAAQFTMYEYGIKKSKISHIFISHLHGDHVFGLPGLLTSYQLAGRKDKLIVYGPAPIRAYLDFNLQGVGHFISYPLEIIELEAKELEMIVDDKEFEVWSFPLEHRIACSGYLFKEKPRRRNFRKEIINQYQPTVEAIKAVLRGEDLIVDGRIIPNERCLLPETPTKSYAYCSDTIYDPKIVAYIKGVTTLYHESTYLKDMADQAQERFHSTAEQAAMIARDAEVDQLILGHYSSRYHEIEVFQQEAEPIFKNTKLAREGSSFII